LSNIFRRLETLLLRVEIQGEAIAAIARPVSSDFDPHLALLGALERASGDGLGMYEVKMLVPTSPELGPHFLGALGDLVERGAVEQASPGRFRLTADEIDQRRENRERAKRQEEFEATEKRRQALEQTKQATIDAERIKLERHGRVTVDAAKKLGFGSTSDACETLLLYYTFQPDPDPAVDRPRFRCTECAATGEVSKLPRSLTHSPFCFTATRTPHASVKA
jgi:hypothetical protein